MMNSNHPQNTVSNIVHTGNIITLPGNLKIWKMRGGLIGKKIYVVQPKNNEADFKLGYDSLPADYPKRRGENEFQINRLIFHLNPAAELRGIQ